MINSIRKNSIGISLMSLSALFVCIGQLMWKISNDGNIKFLLLGFIFYGIGAIVMIIAYKFGSLSVLQPMLSLNYVFSVIIARVILSEPITLSKIVGIIIIVIGIIFIGGGDD